VERGQITGLQGWRRRQRLQSGNEVAQLPIEVVREVLGDVQQSRFEVRALAGCRSEQKKPSQNGHGKEGGKTKDDQMRSQPIFPACDLH
jgi:hypothetical protein